MDTQSFLDQAGKDLSVATAQFDAVKDDPTVDSLQTLMDDLHKVISNVSKAQGRVARDQGVR